ncbi:hypothetical protein M409DRAFT_55015 [Zasmidium cellare ATCC 36951]|uniref:Uncharacterized protein n=1 Tax=Zasmidium cellare ATCC 36951 TaxID=1080233 RepID=A0A6A6CL41_ZASCE|nr:uncharacterized protein M409DRAFT_55015 [Zasmidium cellare ATCC 36951]KAF2166136.1 hypothetical protein M409DRAFT_55015 [Zasmidium cellare ATCC 36951]
MPATRDKTISDLQDVPGNPSLPRSQPTRTPAGDRMMIGKHESLYEVVREKSFFCPSYPARCGIPSPSRLATRIIPISIKETPTRTSTRSVLRWMSTKYGGQKQGRYDWDSACEYPGSPSPIGKKLAAEEERWDATWDSFPPTYHTREIAKPNTNSKEQEQKPQSCWSSSGTIRGPSANTCISTTSTTWLNLQSGRATTAPQPLFE